MKLFQSTGALALAFITAAPVALAVPFVQTPVATPVPSKLKIGDAAPALSIETFVKGTPITALEKGKTYVIQFWAPWKKDSVDQLIGLSAIQKQYADKGVVVFGIASADVTGTTIDKVKQVVTEKGDAIAIPIAWDKGTETKDAFLRAAGRPQLPCAVIVDKEGKIAVLEDANLGLQFLEIVAEGKHDLALLTAWHPKAARAKTSVTSLATAQQGKKWAEVLSYSGELLEVDPIGYGGSAQSRMMAQWKTGAPEKAIEWAKVWIDGPGKMSTEGLNAVAWVLVDPADPFPKPDLDLALKAAERSAELSKNEDGAVLDTLARVHFLKGDVAKAVELQKLAVLKLKPAQIQFKAQIEAALKEYETALAKKG